MANNDTRRFVAGVKPDPHLFHDEPCGPDCWPDMAAMRLAHASRVDWGQPVGDVPVDRYFGVVATPGPLCGEAETMGSCGHLYCAYILRAVRYVTGMPVV